MAVSSERRNGDHAVPIYICAVPEIGITLVSCVTMTRAPRPNNRRVELLAGVAITAITVALCVIVTLAS